MAITLKSLKKIESIPVSEMARSYAADDRLMVLVKLGAGASRPSYIAPRALIGPNLFSAEIRAADLERIEHDPAVESFSLSRLIPAIE